MFKFIEFEHYLNQWWYNDSITNICIFMEKRIFETSDLISTTWSVANTILSLFMFHKLCAPVKMYNTLFVTLTINVIGKTFVKCQGCVSRYNLPYRLVILVTYCSTTWSSGFKFPIDTIESAVAGYVYAVCIDCYYGDVKPCYSRCCA